MLFLPLKLKHNTLNHCYGLFQKTELFKKPSRLGLENTPAASLLRYKTPLSEHPRYDTK